MIDELVNIYKIPNSITRQYNYEKMLTMYNDTLQGKARYLGIIMGATPQAVEDKRRGVYSYEALRSRLSEGKFSRPGARDLLAPVIRLEPLTAEEMLVLCEKLADIHADLYGYARMLTTEDLIPFIKLEYGRIGADQNITPREVIRDFIEVPESRNASGGAHAVRFVYLCAVGGSLRQDGQELHRVYDLKGNPLWKFFTDTRLSYRTTYSARAGRASEACRTRPERRSSARRTTFS